MSKMFPENIRIHIPDATMEETKSGGCKRTKCAIYVKIKEAIGGHGYVSVDASGVAITRRSDYREKAFMPLPALNWMIAFDRWTKGLGAKPKPLTTTFKFFKTTKIHRSRRDAAALKAQREKRKKLNRNKHYDRTKKKRGVRERIVGVAA
jgi:hypothetical protein